MKVFAIANQKGGVGKTTTTVTVGGLLAGRKTQTLVVDLDPHGSLSGYLGYDSGRYTESVYTLFQRAVGGEALAPNELPLPTRWPYLDILPGNAALATLDRQLAAEEGVGLVLARALRELTGRYHFVLFDCPPTLGITMVNALVACDLLVVPVQTEPLALKGVDRLLETLQLLQGLRADPIDYLIVPTMYDRRLRAAREALRKLRAQHGDRVWRAMIPIDTLLRDASERGMPLSFLHPQARGVSAYRALLLDLLSVCGKRVASQSH